MTAFALVAILFYMGLQAATNIHFMKYINKNIVIIALIGVIILLIAHSCSRSKRLEQLAAQNEAYLIKLKSDSTYKLEMLQRIDSEKNARALAENKLSDYKTIQGVVKTRVEVKVKNVEVPYYVHDTTEKYVAIDTSNNCIPVGTAFYMSDSLKYVAGSIGADKIIIDSLGLKPSTILVVIGEKKRGFLKRPEPTVTIDFNHPNIVPVSGQNVIVKDKRKPRRLLWFLGGFAVGAGAVIAVR